MEMLNGGNIVELAVNAGYLAKTRQIGRTRSADEQIRLCVEAGFRLLDCSVDAWEQNWEAQADEILNAAAKYGATVIQSHAPYNFYRKAPREQFLKALERSALAAVRMGVKDLVFHGDEYHPQEEGLFDPKEALEQAYAVLAPSVDTLVSGGVRAALETVFEDRGPNLPREQRSHFCGEFGELEAILDRFHEPMVTCCWDFGHAKLACGNENHAAAIRRMGGRITCTHVHDNYYSRDLHLPPFLGDANWEDLMPALREAGYCGALTFELVYGCLPKERIGEFLLQLRRTGEHLVRLFEAG